MTEQNKIHETNTLQQSDQFSQDRNIKRQPSFVKQEGNEEESNQRDQEAGLDDAYDPLDAEIDEDTTSTDEFAQDQFGDLDDNDPFTNLNETEPEKTNADLDPDPDDLYGLEEPLAKPGDTNRTLRHRDSQGTPVSMDQLGNQQ